MSFHRYIVFRRTIAALCMALAVILSGQAYISVMDRIAHAHHHAHFPNALAGDMQFCGGEHDPCSDHQHGANDPVAPHHGDATVMFLAVQSFLLVACPLEAERCVISPAKFVSVSPRGPDHPPKSTLEIRA